MPCTAVPEALQNATTTTLVIRDSCGRQRASATFRRSWRFNEAQDRREYGFRLTSAEGCDFGSRTWFRSLPIGVSGLDVSVPLAWELLPQ